MNGQPAQPTDMNNGHLLEIDETEVEAINLRVLTQTSNDSRRHPFFTAQEQRLEIIFFRDIFGRLRDQFLASCGPAVGQLYGDGIPIEEFQRVFERLFFVLNDPMGFNALNYVLDANGMVGWGSFVSVYKKRKVTIRLSWSERIFLLFDDPDSSILAGIASIVVLCVIVTSSVVFIVSTTPECQSRPMTRDDASPPVPFPMLSTIELCCLFFFCLEYTTRFCACGLVRTEIFNRQELLELSIGYDTIFMPTFFHRVAKFVFGPSNLIDLAAILPGVIGLFITLEGGAFVVLRLIRLTRVFRALRFIKGPAAVILSTLQQSTTALYVLGFNFLLGIVISGALMYLAEVGDWDKDLHHYLRSVGDTYNNGTGRTEDMDRSPFHSIPHAFWWAMVTATSIGYGDSFPTTGIGYVVGAATMVWSLVILALPVGVIGGTFSKVWKSFELNEKLQEQKRQQELKAITSSIQQQDPSEMSNLMTIEVWNERFPEDYQLSGMSRSKLVIKSSKSRPSPAEFMGNTHLELELPMNRQLKKRLTLPLEADIDIVDRTITGSVTIEYAWTPASLRPGEEDTRLSDTGHEDSTFEPLMGNLQVTLISADRLINLDLCSPHSKSSPFCTVTCYPQSPEYVGACLWPHVWRGPTVFDNLSPQWHSSRDFAFSWTKPKGAPPRADKLGEFIKLLQEVGPSVAEFQEDIRALTARVELLEQGENEIADSS